jgi:hypothetical protein
MTVIVGTREPRAAWDTRDRDILRDAIRGLALLGNKHNRGHVRHVAVAILQGTRDDADAASALEGLQNDYASLIAAAHAPCSPRAPTNSK